MLKHPHLSLHLSGLTLLLISASLAQAQSSLDTVELRGTRAAEPARVDVHRTCPQVREQLADAMARPIYLSGVAGSLRVSFHLNGDRVENVSTEGGPIDYRAPLRRAVRQMSCTHDGQAHQHYNFLVVIRPDAEDDQDQPRLAIQELPGKQLALAR